jgi:ArsR family metal-binding transcriptional regulator
MKQVLIALYANGVIYLPKIVSDEEAKEALSNSTPFNG